MEKTAVSSELPFLRNIIPPSSLGKYIRRADSLSSPDTKEWEKIDFPVEIAFELTNHCNLKCIMCPTPNLKRERGFMDEIVFKKIIKDISRESGFLFLPQGFGEMLLHNKWPQLTGFASGMKIRPIVILTNGMLLNEKNILELMYKVDAIVVTLDGTTAGTYESIRVNSSFEKVRGNIEGFSPCAVIMKALILYCASLECRKQKKK